MFPVPIDNLNQVDALQVAGEGIRKGQERLDEASRGIADSTANLGQVEPQQREQRSDLVRDIVELTRAGRQIQASSRVATTAGSISQEVLNLGRRIDVEA